MAECLNFNYDIINVIKTLTEEISSLRSEFRLLHDTLFSSSNREDKVTEVQKWLTLEQLSDYIPGHPALSTLRRWIKQEGLPSQKIKGRLVFRKDLVDEWIQKRTVTSDMDIERMANESLKSIEKKQLPRWRQKRKSAS